MDYKIKKRIKLFIPPILLSLLKQKDGKPEIAPEYGFFGNYETWEEAEAQCTGYDATNILEKVKDALLQVKTGKAIYERDSVVFDEIRYSWPLLSCLLRAASENENKLHILDFGGSLGSSFFQNKSFLPPLKEFSWNIVEQVHFVDCGKKYFQDDILHFYPDAVRCMKEHKCNVLLLSSVIQYLKNPYEWIEQFKELDCAYVIIARTAFTSNTTDRITVQKVPPSIYEASYVCRFFNEKNFMDAWTSTAQGESGYKVVSSFEDYIDPANDSEKTYFKGFILKNNRLTIKKN
jgi:putative methyltransferase (TIGR04325 family)